MTLTADELDTERPKQGRSAWREVPFLVVLALVLALVLKAVLVQAFSIPSESMENTLKVGDRVVVNKLVYDVRGVHRGEVVVFDGVDDWTPEGSVGTPNALQHVTNFFGLTSVGQKDYIKRVIGLPGDHVMCCSAAGDVVVTPATGEPVELHEPYLFQAAADQDPKKFFCAAGDTAAVCPVGAEGILVPKGRLWVMGDHRGDSMDSRYYTDDGHEGTIPQDQVIGRAFSVVYPVKHWRGLGTPSTFTAAALGAPGGAVGAGLVGALPVTLLRRRSRQRRRLT